MEKGGGSRLWNLRRKGLTPWGLTLNCWYEISVEPTRSPSSKLQISCSFFSEIEFWRNSGRLPDVFNLVCNLDLIHSFLRSSDNLVRADTFVKISSQNCLLLPQTIFSILMCLCKRPRGGAHFRGHVSPIFFKSSPFFSTSPASLSWCSNSVFDCDLVVCVHPLTVDFYPFFDVLK